MFLDVVFKNFNVYREGNLLLGRRGPAWGGGLVCLYMFHQCKY